MKKNIASLILSGVMLIGGCKHTQIGNFHAGERKFPIRQIKVFEKGDCITYSKIFSKCFYRAKEDLCIFYIDPNNNGRYDADQDPFFREFYPCKSKNDSPLNLEQARSPYQNSSF